MLKFLYLCIAIGDVVLVLLGLGFALTPKPFWWLHLLGLVAAVAGCVLLAINHRSMRRHGLALFRK